jgi:hypothetical protein
LCLATRAAADRQQESPKLAGHAGAAAATLVPAKLASIRRKDRNAARAANHREVRQMSIAIKSPGTCKAGGSS